MDSYNLHIEKTFNDDITIAQIKEYFKYVENKGSSLYSMFETGLDENRFDLIRIDPYRQYVRIFEFKSCRRDFISDKKWKNYLDYCHTFTFVCPREIIKKEDLPPGIGLLWLHKWQWKNQIDLSKWFIDKCWVRRPRARDLSKDMLLRIAFMMVQRAKWRPTDVF